MRYIYARKGREEMNKYFYHANKDFLNKKVTFVSSINTQRRRRRRQELTPAHLYKQLPHT